MSSIFNTHEQNAWPADRNLAIYNEMTGLDLKEELKEGGIMIDIGPGRACAALKELSEEIDSVWAIGMAPNIPAEIPRSVTVFGGWTPTFPLPTDERARVITDIFSGVSYAMKPNDDGSEWVPAGLDVLIRAAGWLAPGGVLAACTETRRFGDGWSLDRITKFFDECMGLKCSFQVYRKFAEGNGIYEDQLRVLIRKTNTYDSLVKKAREMVGKPLRGRILWESRDGGAKIFEVNHFDKQYFKRNRDQIEATKNRYDPAVSSSSPAWPDTRDLNTYKEMTNLNISDYLKDGDIYIDSGCGRTCRALGEMAQINPRVRCVGIGLHVPDVLPVGVVAIPASFPEFDFKRIAPARLITDIFGAVSFADVKVEEGYVPAALETLIRLATQLAPEGKLIVCTELDRFGDSFAHQRISEFFKKEMGLNCKFEIYDHLAEDRGIVEKELRIVIESNRDYQALIQKSEEYIGKARNGKILWQSREADESKRMRIMETLFEKPIPSSSQQPEEALARLKNRVIPLPAIESAKMELPLQPVESVPLSEKKVDWFRSFLRKFA